MHPEHIRKIGVYFHLIVIPIMLWQIAIDLSPLKHLSLRNKIIYTLYEPFVLSVFCVGLAYSIIFLCLFHYLRRESFTGARFRKFLRGTRIISARKLKRLTKEDASQIVFAGLPMPRRLEAWHLLLCGATGTGKSVLLRELSVSALKRGDKAVFIDPNGDMLSRLYRKKDVILNPYDDRSEGWSFFNEIRAPYDFQRYALSIVPRGRTEEAEEWAGYSRLLLCETARKLALLGKPSVQELFRWTTMTSVADLKAFLTGTAAESLFVGSTESTKALSSARFILSDKLSEHVAMLDGAFSLRTWLEDQNSKCLFITWREDMGVALRPLISAWVDVICTSILSLSESSTRRVWLIIDELASLEKLSSLQNALTKGRKHGLRVVAGLQSTAQLDDIYGRFQAQSLRSCFRSLVVLGGSRTDPQTTEDMSLSLGEHEVERIRHSWTSGAGFGPFSDGVSEGIDIVKERVVSPSEIANLPELTAYVALAGEYPIAKVEFPYLECDIRAAAFEKRRL